VSSARQPKKRRNRVTFLAIIAAFVLPLLIAWLLTSGVLPWLPKGRLNYGALVEPPVDLSKQTFLDDGEALTRLDRKFGDWTLAVILETPCDNDCRDTLDRMGRIHLALREQMGRVHLAAIVDRGTPTVDLKSVGVDAKTQVYRTVTADLIGLLREARALGDDRSGYNQLVIIDHAGQALMIYPPRPDMGGVHKDLERLLRASKTR